ncbi:hypothetical protein DFH08DRAFT_859508 [Mycena albidolilacea]|uniref:Uncharacterized protein n=1 Tax=Mycena albidolilacea TaxID=1033008 RepID=A0AAD7EV17_9AGAR|nr:hypothetical protein DFH08DRAFT_859508 [Mycena albidolilacea]
MIPRFTNPHFIPRTIQSVARADLFGPQNADHDADDLELQRTLDELIESNLDAAIHARKRRKLNPPETEEEAETSVLFRLLSTPHTISLLPPPPPPPVTREPEYEDTESAAETRRQWAAAVACDAAWVIQESTRLPPPFRAGRVEHVKAALPSSAPSMMLAQCLQRPRKTRPPVPRSELQHYPYVAAPILPSLAASACVPCVEVEVVRDSPRKTRRRRRGKFEQNRPQARFWWPPEGCGGKSLGYAMGY